MTAGLSNLRPSFALRIISPGGKSSSLYVKARLKRSLVSTIPPAVRTATSLTTSPISLPQLPAFMATAPPRVPGIPAMNSTPARPFSAQYSTSLCTFNPAPTRILGSATVQSSTEARDPFKIIATPSNPPSLTRRLLPLPITK